MWTPCVAAGVGHPPPSAQLASRLEQRLRRELETRIAAAFDDAVAPDSSGVAPDKKTAFLLFLRNSEAQGVALPKGFFSVAKMIDGIDSQQEGYGIEPVFDITIENFLKSSMTLGEYVALGRQYIGGSSSKRSS